MTKNVGTIDRIIRVIIGLILIAFVIPDPGFRRPGGTGSAGSAMIPILTAIFSTCPAYSLIGARPANADADSPLCHGTLREQRSSLWSER